MSQEETQTVEVVEEKVKEQELSLSHFPDINKGSLLVVTIGNDEEPATVDDVKRVSERLKEEFDETLGVRILVIPHTMKVEALTIPALRSLQSEIAESCKSNPDSISKRTYDKFGEF